MLGRGGAEGVEHRDCERKVAGVVRKGERGGERRRRSIPLSIDCGRASAASTSVAQQKEREENMWAG